MSRKRMHTRMKIDVRYSHEKSCNVHDTTSLAQRLMKQGVSVPPETNHQILQTLSARKQGRTKAERSFNDNCNHKRRLRRTRINQNSNLEEFELIFLGTSNNFVHIQSMFLEPNLTVSVFHFSTFYIPLKPSQASCSCINLRQLYFWWLQNTDSLYNTVIRCFTYMYISHTISCDR